MHKAAPGGVVPHALGVRIHKLEDLRRVYWVRWDLIWELLPDQSLFSCSYILSLGVKPAADVLSCKLHDWQEEDVTCTQASLVSHGMSNSLCACTVLRTVNIQQCLTFELVHQRCQVAHSAQK